ncbi:MAG: hypothetical protein RL095_3522 [Verrucomicrobiota bacterium]|jgi:hypothetical protein
MDEQPKLKLLQNHWKKESKANAIDHPYCNCLDPKYFKGRELEVHQDVQDEEAPGWLRILKLIDEAANDGREVFSPLREMDPEEWMQIVTLPTSIVKLQNVKHFIVYGSNLSRIPPEIGEMRSLEEFTPYTSYRLHWFPYEILRCKKLKQTTVSTRAVYGNYKHRPPFPLLPQYSDLYRPKFCSICTGEFKQLPIQRWVSLRMGSDIVPLLVHACSVACLDTIQDAPDNYVKRPHCGGTKLKQPAT